MDTMLNIATAPPTVIVMPQVVYQHFEINTGPNPTHNDEGRGLKWLKYIITAAQILLGCYKVFRTIFNFFS